jgi:hypothetical protein
VRPPLPPLLLLLPVEELPLGLLGKDVEGADGEVEGADGDLEGTDGDLEGEDNSEEDEPFETVLQRSMVYWLTEELL